MEIKLKLTKMIPRVKIIGDSKEYENEILRNRLGGNKNEM